MSDAAIVLITKNRPAILLKTLDYLKTVDIKLVIIDDSTTTETYKAFRDKCKERNVIYHGRSEQRSLLMKYKNLKLDKFVRPLGLKEWNLGYVRNYALVASKSFGFAKILFMDDDIVIRDSEQIYHSFDELCSCEFVGAKVNGTADDSIVGHLMRSCDGEFYEFLAGGFLAFDISTISEYFFNYYNEDQIWLFLHPPETRFETYCEVEQQQFDPFKNAVTKALRQEFGELLEEGTEEAFRCGDHDLLLKEGFWKDICDARISYIDQLPKLCVGTNVNHIGLNVHRALTQYYSRISHELFVRVFQQYFKGRELWRTVLESI